MRIFRSRRRAFTLIEIILVVALLGTLAMMIVPRALWTEPPKRVLQRALIEAVDIARSGVSVRFRIDKEENIGAVIPEILVKDNEAAGNAEGTWKPFKARWELTGNSWTFKPEIIYFFQDGMCTPARITWGTFTNDEEKYLLTVTGYLVEDNKF